MEKYINVKNLANHLNEECKMYLEDDSIQCTIAAGVVCSIKEDILRLPTVDVAEIVRCKDCKHYERPNLDEDEYYCTAEHTNKLFSPNKSDYCSYGERKIKNA